MMREKYFPSESVGLTWATLDDQVRRLRNAVTKNKEGWQETKTNA
jgi:hypothetical protein